jgi:glycosyltransferase involved in cell wall biosynthesis
VAAFVGRIVSFKGIRTLVQAFREVTTVEPTAKLLMIGGRDPQHPSGLTDYDEDWLRGGVSVRITGFTATPERYLSACDYLVMPSVREGLSTVIMEALCMGLPIVTTTARGCGELVQHAETGLIVAPGDSRAFVGALLEMTRNVSARRQWAAAAMRQRDRFDRSDCIREMLDIYDQLLATPKPTKSNPFAALESSASFEGQ